MKMRNLKYLFLIFSMILVSCEEVVDGINENPNQLTADDVDPKFFLTGMILANTQVQVGHLSRISALWSGQLTGFASLYSNIYGYNISAAEANGTWFAVYVGVIPNARTIQNSPKSSPLLVGISKVLEANAVGTAASIFGDVPYSQAANDEFKTPAFDGQKSVFTAVIALLDDAIADLSSAASDKSLTQDIYFTGDAQKWVRAAQTLKARYYLEMKDYANAYNAAQNGINAASGSMYFKPGGSASVTEGDKNLFFQLLAGSRGGDIGTGNSYLMQLLDPANGGSRNNAKTDETARFGYYYINESGGAANTGVAAQFEPQPIVTFEENQLILAETGLRTKDFATALAALNVHRAYLNGGGRLNATHKSKTYKYEPYTAADFAAGGIENAGGLTPERALLREIIEERFVSGFGTFIPFNDARRLRKNDNDINVPFPFNIASASKHPERFPYSDDELSANSNAPAEPGIYTVTEVNR